MRDLFEMAGLTGHLPKREWQPPALPSLANVKDLELDCETDGLQWWNGDKPIGISICLPDFRTFYFPFGHRGGGNLPEEQVRRWAQRELRGKHITNTNTRFDVHMLREWGVDLEAQGCTVSDVAHYAALLDERRQRFSQSALVSHYLEGEEKIEVVDGHRLDTTRMADYHAGIVAVRAEADVRQVRKLKLKMLPMLAAEDLDRVRKLEEELIFVVCEMEKNGAIIDLELLDRWVKESEQQYLRLLWSIHRQTGVKFTGTNQSWQDLFKKLGIPVTEFTDKGTPSFKDEIIKRIDHPLVQQARRAVRLASIRSKYLVKYQQSIDRNGILRYALHQLRAQKDPLDDNAAGTVSGRFSSTAIDDDVGVNIQQVMKVAKQRVMFGYDENDSSHDDELFIIRQLHIPGSGLFLSADAEQIEYRLFAHHANTKAVIDAYKENPRMSFHKFVWGMVKKHKPDITYRRQKDLNFAKIYGAGLKKMALMLEFITPTQYAELVASRARSSHPLLASTREVADIYNQVLPEVAPLLRMASHLAKPHCDRDCDRNDILHRQHVPHRGFVRTLLGRRTRFPEGYRLHKALNAVIQGSAADIMKTKLIELHKARKETGFLLRYTVHDEVDGDVPDQEAAQKVAAILDHQSFPELRVPILWGVSTGKNWKEAS